jgi:hypothetical protein
MGFGFHFIPLKADDQLGMSDVVFRDQNEHDVKSWSINDLRPWTMFSLSQSIQASHFGLAGTAYAHPARVKQHADYQDNEKTSLVTALLLKRLNRLNGQLLPHYWLPEIWESAQRKASDITTDDHAEQFISAHEALSKKEIFSGYAMPDVSGQARTFELSFSDGNDTLQLRTRKYATLESLCHDLRLLAVQDCDLPSGEPGAFNRMVKVENVPVGFLFKLRFTLIDHFNP